jgi:hypothetical protein
VSEPQPSQPLWRRIISWPCTRLGWWSVGLAAVFEILMIITGKIFMRLPEDVTWREMVLPFYGIFMMLCGLAAGIVALTAVIRQHERSWLVWMILLVVVNAPVLVLGEFPVLH